MCIVLLVRQRNRKGEIDAKKAIPTPGAILQEFWSNGSRIEFPFRVQSEGSTAW